MVKLLGGLILEGYDENNKRLVRVRLCADNQSDLIGTSGADVYGLDENDIMTFGSTCLCANGDFGMLNSSGTWVF